MDLFDGEPYAELMPRALRRVVGWALLISFAVVPPARNWILEQAQQHVMHEIRPLLSQFGELPESPVPGSDRG
jgi:hypothetical protein